MAMNVSHKFNLLVKYIEVVQKLNVIISKTSVKVALNWIVFLRNGISIEFLAGATFSSSVFKSLTYLYEEVSML